MRLNPEQHPRAPHAHHRAWAATRSTELLPPLVEALRDEGRHVVWACDPMHGNTFVAPGGQKTRRFDDILVEIARLLRRAPRRWAPGRAASTSSSPATTSPSASAADHASTRATSTRTTRRSATPASTPRQSLDMAFHVAEFLQGYSAANGARSL